MEAHKAVNRQFYRRQEVLDYPDIIHVKSEDPHRSDVVCFRTFGQAYMDVVPHPATTEDDYQTTQYIRPRMLAKAWRERIFDAIDRLKQDETLQFAGFGHEFDHCSVSQVIEGLYIAVGNMEEMLRELEETGCIRPYNRERERCEQEERIRKILESKSNQDK